jgi:hypothetical protein
MTPKEKADELYTHMFECVINPELTVLEMEAMAIQCALIAVDEILKSMPILPSPIPCSDYDQCSVQATTYWQQVRTEIENL